MGKPYTFFRFIALFVLHMIFWLCIAVLLGLIFWSFGSVILSRWGESSSLEQASSILRGRSACPHCKHRLYARDLIPLVSFLIQGGKCRYCHKPISRLYPILELWSGLIFWLLYWNVSHQGLDLLIFWTISSWILRLLVVYDVLWYEVHIPLVIAGVVVLIWWLMLDLFPLSILWWAVVFLSFFILMYWSAKRLVQVKYQLKEEWIWFGDVIIAPYLGALLYAGLPISMGTLDRTLVFLFFLTISWGIGILRYLIQNKYYQSKASFLSPKMADQAVPFLPAMILGVAIMIVYHNSLFSLFGF